MRTTDRSWRENGPVPRHGSPVRTSRHLEARDGTKLAIDLHLPEGLAPQERVPTILLMTPYFRAMEFRSRFVEKLVRWKLASSGGSLSEEAESFVPYGYATVVMDLRGSGASYGRKETFFHDSVARDGADVVDWIVGQPWSNGAVGATGVSALGLTAMFLLLARHPAVKAIAPRSTIFDLYAGTHPGGLTASRFMVDVGAKLRAMDSNRLHEMPEGAVARWLTRLLVKGLRGVDEDRDGRMLAGAIRDHEANEYLDRALLSVTHRDDPLPDGPAGAGLDDGSPHTHAAVMEASRAPIYSYVGWLDGAFSKEMLLLHQSVRTRGSRLTIGPWGHGSRWYTSPVLERARRTDFDQTAELIRFFDAHLKGVDDGITDEPPVHYFTMGEERWKTSEVWPPSGAETTSWYLAPDRCLSREAAGVEGNDEYRVDPAAGTGVHSRFGKHLIAGAFPVCYPDRRRRDERLLCYTSPPLEHDTEVTGHPVVTLFLRSTSADGAVIVYLEDVTPVGDVRNVTDGMMRVIHRKVSAAAPPYPQAGPYRTFGRSDASELPEGEPVELAFDLLPVSYLFRQGHSIRLAVAGGDKDNFVVVPPDEVPTLWIHRGGARASRVDLPVMRRPLEH